VIRRRNRTEFDHGHHLAVGFTENLALFEVPITVRLMILFLFICHLLQLLGSVPMSGAVAGAECNTVIELKLGHHAA
jgi:hypothetical protein